MKTNNEYAKLLATPEWKAKRESVLKLRNYTCQRCSSQTKLHVHHTYYDLDKKPWEYDSDSLLVLCKSCHFREHAKIKSSKHKNEIIKEINRPATPDNKFKVPKSLLMAISNKELSNCAITSNSKLVYMYLLYEKMNNTKVYTTYNIMRYKYGIFEKTYQKALNELSRENFIKYKKPNKSGVDVAINTDILRKDEMVEVPISVLLTDTLTNNHKMFLILIFSTMMSLQSKSNVFRYSIRSMCRQLEDIGFSKTTTYSMFKDISGGGYIQIFEPKHSYFILKRDAIEAMKSRRIKVYEDSLSLGLYFPIYTKPKPHDFQLLEVDGKLTIVSNK